MKLKREEFLRRLEAVRAGLAQRETVEQSTCFVFERGHVYTFDGEMSVSGPSGLEEDVTGAVRAKDLLNHLRKLEDDEVQVDVADGRLRVKDEKARTRDYYWDIDPNIALPLEEIEAPGEFAKLPADFADALKIVTPCASLKEDHFARACVHVHPRWVEATNDTQLARYRLKTGFSEPALLRRAAAAEAASLGVSEFSETTNWVHFRAGGVQLSCRRYVEEYEDQSAYLEVEGEPVTLPKGLVEASDRLADVCDATEDKLVTVKLTKNRVRVSAEGAGRGGAESRKCVYEGPPLSFVVAPGVLKEIVDKYPQCVVNDARLKITGGNEGGQEKNGKKRRPKWEYVCCLGSPDAQVETVVGAGEGGEE